MTQSAMLYSMAWRASQRAEEPVEQLQEDDARQSPSIASLGCENKDALVVDVHDRDLGHAESVQRALAASRVLCARARKGQPIVLQRLSEASRARSTHTIDVASEGLLNVVVVDASVEKRLGRRLDCEPASERATSASSQAARRASL